MIFFSFLGHIKKLILRKIKKMREKSDFLSFLFFWTFTTITTYIFSWFNTFYYYKVKYYLFLKDERICFFSKYSYNRERKIWYKAVFKIFWHNMERILLEILWFYLFSITVITFCIRGLDKYKAKKGKWRISEKTLLILSMMGGRIGAIGAIGFFRHKTVKSAFLWRFYLIGFVWIIGILVLIYLLS